MSQLLLNQKVIFQTKQRNKVKKKTLSNNNVQDLYQKNVIDIEIDQRQGKNITDLRNLYNKTKYFN